MRLLGNAFKESELLQRLEERLRARGLLPDPEKPVRVGSVEPRIDPLSFNLAAMEEHADPTRPVPLQTHRGGMGRAVLLAKLAFRSTCQVFINETLARQRLFNGHVRDSYAQLSAEVLRLRGEVEKLRAPTARKKASRHRPTS
jgi:hypothetical protein